MDIIGKFFDSFDLNQPDWGITGWASVLSFFWAVLSSLYGLRQRKNASTQREKNKSLIYVSRHAIKAMMLCKKCSDINRDIESKKYDTAKDGIRELRSAYRNLMENRHHNKIWEEEQWVGLSTRVTVVGEDINGFKGNTSLDNTKPTRDAIDLIAEDFSSISAKYENYLGQSQ